jgi:hypothetical protein
MSSEAMKRMLGLLSAAWSGAKDAISREKMRARMGRVNAKDERNYLEAAPFLDANPPVNAHVAP